MALFLSWVAREIIFIERSSIMKTFLIPIKSLILNILYIVIIFKNVIPNSRKINNIDRKRLNPE